MHTSDTIIFCLAMINQKVRVHLTLDTSVPDSEESSITSISNLAYALWEIIWTVTLKMLLTVTRQWATKKMQWLVNAIKCKIGKWVVQNIRYQQRCIMAHENSLVIWLLIDILPVTSPTVSDKTPKQRCDETKICIPSESIFFQGQLKFLLLILAVN